MENNKLIKLQTGLVKQVGGVLSITNKLLSQYNEPFLIPYRRSDKWGFSTVHKKIVIDCIYDQVSVFKNGISRVLLNRKELFIDKYGREVLDSINLISQVEYHDWSYRVLDAKGRNVSYLPNKTFKPIKFELLAGIKLSEGFLRVERDKKWGFIDSEGHIKIPFIYDYVEDFHNGSTQVVLDKVAFLINKDGKAISTTYDYSGGASDIEYLIDLDRFSDNLLRVRIDSKWGFINRQGIICIPNKYDVVDNFSDGVAKVAIQGKWGLIDTSGKLMIPIIYNELGQLSESLIWAKENEKCGFIDLEGNTVIPFVFDECKDFNHGVAIVKSNKYGLINKQGKTVLGNIYDNIRNFSEGITGVCKDGKCGYVNLKGEIVVSLIFNAVSEFHNNIALVKNENDLFGFIDKNGDQFWED